MRTSSLITLMIAVILGLLAVVVMNKKIANSRVEVAMVETVVARSDLARGIKVTADMVEIKQIRKDLITLGSLKSTEDALDRILIAPVSKDEILTENRLGPKGENGLAVQIKEGMRAFTIETPKVSSGVGGMIQPGNHVDVILTVTENNQSSDNNITGGGSSTVLLQNIEVLAVDKQTDLPTENKAASTPKSTKDLKDTKSITLLVTPDQSAFLTLGQTKGVLHLTLRHPNDSVVLPTQTATMRQMQFMQSGPASVSDRLKSTFLDFVKSSTSDKTGSAKSTDETNRTNDEEKSVTAENRQRITHIRIVRGQQEDLVRFQPAN
jgi:pilus assembly protein CpaB